MPCTVVLGCQWGDEGKGKIVDLLAEKADWVARFQGGANAGHTVYVDGKKAILHLIPTGILRPGVMCAIGNGVVMDPLSLLTEVRGVEAMPIPCRDRLRISTGVHLVTPLHGVVERFRQQDSAIGTTKRGIGPAYEDKAARRGLRGEDLIHPQRFRDRLYSQWDFVQAMIGDQKLQSIADPHWQRFEDLLALLEPARAELAPMVCDVTDLLLTADDEGKEILCEGAQGTWLDIDHGTYPFVTSSNTSVGGVCTGLGIPPKRITKVIGIVKAYTTRVGHGPFPTEFDEGPWAEKFRQQSGEFGATTGRPRRCGWFDAVLARRSVRINGVDELIVTKLDVLNGIDPLQIAVSYGNNGAEGINRASTDLEGVNPEFVQMPGWEADLSGSCTISEFPPEAHEYLNRLSEAVGAPIGLVSIGPGREQVVAMNA
jgi:adenylosuccinate synthase